MLWYEAFDAFVNETCPDLQVLCEEPMALHTTFKIGGPARRMAFPETEETLLALLSKDWPCLVIGNGSNLLVSDKGLDLLVINLSKFLSMELVRETTVRASAGVPLSRLAVFAMKAGLTGLEFAHGIPGTLGGAVFMNAGAYGGEMCQVVTRVEAYFPGRGVVTLSREELAFDYRRSIFSSGEGVVLWAELTLQPGDEAAIRATMEDLGERRRSKQPLNFPSAGSTFKRPVGYFAGALIEQCGLKGYAVGGAQVSEKHAGFVINRGGATANDVLQLIRDVKDRVLKETGVCLEPEIRLLGEE